MWKKMFSSLVQDFDLFLLLAVVGTITILMLMNVNCELRNKIETQKETIDSLNVQVENYKLLYKLGE